MCVENTDTIAENNSIPVKLSRYSFWFINKQIYWFHCNLIGINIDKKLRGDQRASNFYDCLYIAS